MTEIKKTRSEVKREAIIEAAKKAFHLYGAKETSMDKLAEMAQVSKRTVYNHFACKETLIMEIVSQVWTSVAVENPIIYQADKPLKEQLLALISIEVELLSCQDYIDLVRVAIGHSLHDAAAMCQQMEKFEEQETSIQKWLKAAMADKRLRSESVDFLAAQIKSLIYGSAFWPQMLHKRELLSDAEKQKLIEHTADLILCSYQR